MLNDYFETFYHMTTTVSADEQGGRVEALEQGAAFQAGIGTLNRLGANVADQNAERVSCVLFVPRDSALRQDDVVKRASDGTLYRVASSANDLRTPERARLAFSVAYIEKVTL